MTFQELGLKENIVSAINKLGFEQPTPIQEQAIPVLIKEDRDLVGLAQTGTGKTAAFGLPLLHNIDDDSKITQGLIICPTRELCLQITRDLEGFSSNIRKMKVVPVYGGTDIVRQMKQVKANPQIIVATPGRLLDLIKRKAVQLNNISHVVLDEADEMLNMGFKEDIDSILKTTPKTKSVWLFSATMPKDVARIASNYMTDPFEITVGTKNESAKNIKHIYYTVNERKKYDALKRIVDSQKDIFGVIFCRTRISTQKVADMLTQDGHNAEALHGDLSQAQRDRVMDKFRNRTIKLLVATDVAARGIDVDDVTHVIHHHLPEDIENYTHRSGRTARAGKSGISMCFIGPKEFGKIKALQKKLQITFEEGTIPTAENIFEERLKNYVEKVIEPSKFDSMKMEQLPELSKMFDHLSREELIKKFIVNHFEPLLSNKGRGEDLNQRPDRNAPEYKGRKGGKGRNSKEDANKVRFFVNLGGKDGLNPGGLIRVVCDSTGLSGSEVGRIDIKDKFTFFEADKEYADGILNKMKGVKFEGQDMNIELGNSNDGRGPSKGGGGRDRKNSKDRKSSSRSKGNDKKRKSERFF